MNARLASWMEVLRTQNLSRERPMDAVSRWLLVTRASVFPMTLCSGAIGGLLAFARPGPEGASLAFFLEALLGLLAAHAANNMINDYFDLEEGIDAPDSVRGRYAPHPLLAGLVSRRQLLAAIVAANALDLAILIHLMSVHGWVVAAFALAGLAISVGYVAPPIRLKQRGLGEPGVLLVWGPLMIGGTYYVTTGTLPGWVVLASLPYGLLVATVLVGKHLDKLEPDRARGVRTLPVRLGERRSRALAQASIGAFFALVGALVAGGVLSPWTLLVGFALPRAGRVIRVLGQPRPAQAPPGYPIWPLWYVAWSFLVARLAGGLLVAGLALDALLRAW